jgi:hypothetical protein
MQPQDPEQRIADLERQLGEAKAAAFSPNSFPPNAFSPNSFSSDAFSFNDFGQQPYSSTGSLGTPLANAPRRVPLRFLLAELLPFRWWYVFALFIIAIPPIIVWIMEPPFLLPAAVLSLVVIYGIHVRGAVTRLALLKWGQVATVTGSELISQATYYGGTTYSNVVLPVARGWTVTRPVWSGPKSKTRIRYQLDGYQGELVVGGREYVDGVVLADQRKPQRALCVTSFPYDLDRNESGNWAGRLRVRLLIGMFCWLLIMIGWVGGAAVLYRNYDHYLGSLPGGTSGPVASAPSPTLTPAPGASVIVNGANEIRSIVCNGNDVTVNGATNRVDITGHCLSLTVSGSGNHVSVDVSDSITTNGMNNLVTFRVGEPVITNGGMSNVVKPG